MTNQSETFGRLLRGAINSIAAYEGKTAVAVEEELGGAVGLSSAAIQRYKAGTLPPETRTVQILAASAIQRGYLGRAWLQRFLQAAQFPMAADLIAHLIGDSGGAPPLPGGTLAFLFTDIAGSTQRWEKERTAMEEALIRHDILMRQSIELNGGQVFKTVGDAFYAVFATVPNALEAAIAAQRVILAEFWPTNMPIQVRMAIHAGAAQPRDGDYFGAPLNRVARLCAAGHGGQMLLSAAAWELARDQLPEAVTLRELGERRLKDLGRPERIFQIVIPDLPAEFPRLNALDQYRHNLPPQATILIGRERETRAVCDLLRAPETRLLTLTGPGGVGKTRLALQAAADLLDDYPDGVWFVGLASVRDHASLPAILTTILGIATDDARPAIEHLHGFLRHRSILLVLDNYEQLADAALFVGELLADAPGVNVLVTSRVALRLYGEREFIVPPLGLPDPQRLPTPERVPQYDALRLFIERARAVRPDFAVTNETAPVIAEICARLDGLPLAIELAAARSRLFPPRALLARLDRRLSILTGGARDLPARHQTLRDTIAWSYDMLDIAEQTLFARLSVFSSGWTLEAAEHVCGDSGSTSLPLHAVSLPMDDIAALLEALVGKSLVRIEDGFDGEPRFAMLETIREYTQERLVHSDEYDLIHEQLVTFFVTMAEAAAPHLEGCEQHMWIERLGHDYENLYTALQWCRSSAERAELGLRLVTALGRFWNLRGHRRAARDWCRNFLGQLSPTPPSLHHARALAFAAELESPDDLDRAERWLLQSLEIAHALGDTRSAAVALHGLGGVAHERSDLSGAQAHYEESLALLEQSAAGPEETVYLRFNIGQIARDLGELDRARAHMEASLGIMRQLGDLTGIGAMLQILAYMSRDSGNAQQAGAQLQESLGIWKKLDNRLAMATILSDLADLARDQGDLAQAVACYQQCLQVVHTLPDAFDRAWPLRHFGYVTYLQGNAERAMALVQESLTLFVKQADREGLASCLELMAALWADEQPEQAARLWGMGAMLRTTIEMPLPSSEQILREQRTAVAQARLGSRTFEVAWSAGQQLSLDQAIAEALDGCIN